MARLSRRSYKIQVLVIMTVYLLLMVFEWPLTHTAPNLTLRAILAVLPTVPLVLVLALAARRVMHGDELEQRLHLIALSVAVAVVGAASFVGAFLVAAKVWHVGGDVLFWVFPALAVVYAATRLVLVRRFTGSWNLWGCW